MHSKSCRLQRKGGGHDGQSDEREKGPRNRSGRERVKGAKRGNVEDMERTGGEGRAGGERLETTWEKKESNRGKVKWRMMIERIQRYARDKTRTEGLNDQAGRSTEEFIVSRWIINISLMNI
jgi:hypothetical protein